jgi:hypothetical protein
MTEEEEILQALGARERRGLVALADAGFDLEPLHKRANIGPIVAERLVNFGLAEKRPCSDRYASIGLPDGYRLSELGWRVKERARRA